MIRGKRQTPRLTIQQRFRAKNRRLNAHALRSLVEWSIEDAKRPNLFRVPLRASVAP